MTPEENFDHRPRIPSQALRIAAYLAENQRCSSDATMNELTACVVGPNAQFREPARPLTSPGMHRQVAT